jgi:hypothetical protein
MTNEPGIDLPEPSARPDVSPETEAVRRRLAEDPRLEGRLREIRAAIDSDERLGPAITPERLPEYLRERG